MKVKMRKEERAKRKKASVRQIREGEGETWQKRRSRRDADGGV